MLQFGAKYTPTIQVGPYRLSISTVLYTVCICLLLFQWSILNEVHQMARRIHHNDPPLPMKTSLREEFTRRRISVNEKSVAITPLEADLLWKGDATGGDGTRYKHVTIVISHCYKDLSWVQKIIEGHELHVSKIYVISKCGNKVLNAPENAVVMHLSNVGRCDHTFAYWMARMSPDTPDDEVVVFMKDNRDMHQVSRSSFFMSRFRYFGSRGIVYLSVGELALFGRYAAHYIGARIRVWSDTDEFEVYGKDWRKKETGRIKFAIGDAQPDRIVAVRYE